MPTAFVTGATGFLGLNLVEALTREGWQVTALHRPTSDLATLRRFDVQLRVGAVEDLASLRAALPQAVDAVFHVAGKTGFWRAEVAQHEATNVLGTRNMVRAALERKARRFVHTSSMVAYGNLGTHLTEATRPDAATSPIAYVRTKYLGEQAVREGIAQGLDAVILNPSHVLGPYDTRNWGRTFRLAVESRLPAPPGVGSFCHAGEVARAHLAAFRQGRTGENYLLACVDAPFLALVQGICTLVGRKPPARALPSWVIRLGALAEDARAGLTGREPNLTRDLVPFICQSHTCSGEKARRELGYRAHTLPEILGAAHAWLSGQGLLG